MPASLNSLLEGVSCLAIIGMEKNAGKTTVLNSLIEAQRDRTVGITSIGFDGESIDQVTGTNKPMVWVKSGSFVATASSLIGSCDFTRELLEFTGFYTPMGEVIILRALSDGYAQIAGPSIVSQMEELVKALKRNGADLVFIDGAASRKSTASITFADGCILASGASFSHNMETVVNETAFYTELLSLPESSYKLFLTDKLREWERGNQISQNQCFIFKENNFFELAGSNFDVKTVDVLESKIGKIDGIFFNGAVTKIIIERLLKKVPEFKGLNLVTLHGNSIQLNSSQYAALKNRGVNISVIFPINLLAVSSNPISPSGIQFDKNAFKSSLESNLRLPVFDVCDSGAQVQ